MKISSHTHVLLITASLTLFVACLKEKKATSSLFQEESPWVFPSGLEKSIRADCFALQSQDIQVSSGLLEFRDVPTFERAIQSLGDLSQLNADFLSLRNNLSTLEPLTGKGAKYPALKAFEKRFPGFNSGFFRTRINESLSLKPQAVHTRLHVDMETPTQVVFNHQHEIKIGLKIFKKAASAGWLLITDGDMTTLNYLRTEPSLNRVLKLANVKVLHTEGAFNWNWLKDNY